MRPTTRPGGRKARLTRADEATHPTTMNPSIALYTHLRARHALATRPDSTREWNRLPAGKILRASALPAWIQPAHPGANGGFIRVYPQKSGHKKF